MKKSIGIAFPFIDDNNVLLGVNKDTKNETISNLLHFILTKDDEKFERLYLPNFGTSLEKYLFEPITEELTSEVTTEIKNKVNKFFPQIEINEIFYNLNEDNLLISIDIQYKINDGVYEKNDRVNIGLNI